MDGSDVSQVAAISGQFTRNQRAVGLHVTCLLNGAFSKAFKVSRERRKSIITEKAVVNSSKLKQYVRPA